MTFEEIERLIRLVAETDLTEVEVKRSGVHVRVSRHAATHHAPAQASQVAAPAAGPVPQAAQPPAAGRVEPADEGLHVVTATMVGTFYRRPNPEAPAFVKEGDAIRKGQVVCILEAMKILNEIESDVNGTVVKIHAEDAQPVEFGEKLFTIRLA